VWAYAHGIGDISDARRTMRLAFQYDEGYELGYIANISMILHDNPHIHTVQCNGDSYRTRDEVSKLILDRVFGE